MKNVVLGKIVGVFGVKGQVKIYSDTRPREQILQYSPWLLDNQGTLSEYEVLDGGAQGKGLIAKLSSIEDRDAAGKVVGSTICIPEANLPDLDQNEYYWSQLEGARVVNLADIELGSVKYLFDTGANDVMVVQGEKEHMIPFTRDAVLDVDLEQHLIRVDWDQDF